MGDWMNETEVAEWLGVPVPAVLQAIGEGVIPALRLAGNVRINRQAVIAAGHGNAPSSASEGKSSALAVPDEVEPTASIDGLPTPSRVVWVDELAPADPFVHRWPQRKDAPGTGGEAYPAAWAGVVTIAGQRMEVQVGESEPRGDGCPRLTVFFNNYPEAEFAPTTARDGWASVIKPNGKATLRSGDPVPALYARSRLSPYQDATGFVGSGRPRGMALVISANDMRSAVHHAAARWLGKRGHPLAPAS